MCGGSGGGGTTQSTTTQELAPEQRQLLSLVIPEAQKIIANPPQLFPSSSIAGFDPLQTAGQEATIGAAVGPVQDTATGAAGAFDFLSSGAVLDPRTNPGLRGAIQAGVRPLARQFTTSVLPNIRNEAVSAGGFGGSRQGIAEGLASQGFLESVGDTAANIVNPGFNAGLNAFTTGLALAPSVADLQSQPGRLLEAVGTQRRQLGQAQLSEEAQRFLSEQIIPFSVAQDVAALAFGIGGGSSTTTSNAPKGPDNTLNTILGIGAIAASIFCWTAREVYGTRDGKWFVFRHWMIHYAPMRLVRLYARYGERFAGWIADKPRIKWMLRILMDKAVKETGYGTAS